MSGQVLPSALLELVDSVLETASDAFSEEDSEFVTSLMYLIPSAICTYYKRLSDDKLNINIKKDRNFVLKKKGFTFKRSVCVKPK